MIFSGHNNQVMMYNKELTYHVHNTSYIGYSKLFVVLTSVK